MAGWRSMNSHTFATSHAALTSSSVASALPMRTLSRTVPLKSAGSWLTSPTCKARGGCTFDAHRALRSLYVACIEYDELAGHAP